MKTLLLLLIPFTLNAQIVVLTLKDGAKIVNAPTGQDWSDYDVTSIKFYPGQIKDTIIYNVIDSTVVAFKDSTVYVYSDSTIYDLKDSIIWETIQVDSIVRKDSTVFHYSDSIIYDTTIVWYRMDSVIYDTVQKDSIRWIPTPCPECEEAEPATWKIIALIVTTIMTLFIVLYLTKK